jgi:hypothetical protein
MAALSFSLALTTRIQAFSSPALFSLQQPGELFASARLTGLSTLYSASPGMCMGWCSSRRTHGDPTTGHLRAARAFGVLCPTSD